MKSFDDRPDISSEERMYNRSIRIRRATILWLDRSVGKGWPSLGDMADDCANSTAKGGIPFSSQTAGRWLNQFTAPSFAFGISSRQAEEDGLYRIVRRRPLRASDFKRWGIPVPKRFKRRNRSEVS